MSGPHQEHHLPLCPIADPVGVHINDGDEGDMQPEPQQLDYDPEEEIALEAHFARDGILPECEIQPPITPPSARCYGGGCLHTLTSDSGIFTNTAVPHETRGHVGAEDPHGLDEQSFI